MDLVVVSERRREYLRNYNREWIARRRAEWFAGKRCAQCGSTEHMEIDHIDPAKKVAHQVWSWTEPRRLAELAKCQVLCHDCHLAKTTADWHAARRHGTATMYERGGCRCGLCRLWKKNKNARFRPRRLD